jgi:hypothetical protein
MIARRATTLALPVLAALLSVGSASAQDVRAEVQIRTGPVSGRVVIGDDPYRYPRERDRVVVVERNRRPSDRVVVVERRNARRVTIVEDFRGNSQRAHARHENRHVVAFWDPRRDEYGFQRWRAGLRPVLLCEHGGKFYVLDRGYLARDRYRDFDRDDYRDDRDDRYDRGDARGRRDRRN